MSEIKTLEIPKWGLSMEEGTIAQWLIKEGEQFSKGQEICGEYFSLKLSCFKLIKTS